MWRSSPSPTPTIEGIRKIARILVIDDHAFPALTTFERDGYHFERWATVKNLSQLTDGHYHLILLDIHGIGLKESPDLQGLGILKHIKVTNPAQPVIVYSSKPQLVTSNEYLMLADAVLDKGMSYVQYKERVDELLLRRATPGYFIAAMNQTLSEDAALAPKAVQKALRAMDNGNTDGLARYLQANLTDPKKIDKVVTIVGVGVKTVRLFTS
jgi:DNA-binding response OmpR family regulator